MCGTHTDSLCQGLHSLADGHNQSAIYRRAINPLALQILYLQTFVLGDLQQITRKHAVLMRAYSLPLYRLIALFPEPQLLQIGVFDNLQFVLLLFVKVFVERIWGQPYRLSDQRCEVDGDLAHQVDVLAIDRLEIREVRGGGPLGGGEQIPVERLSRESRGMIGGKVDLLAMVNGMCCYLGVESRIAQEAGGILHLNLESGGRYQYNPNKARVMVTLKKVRTSLPWAD